MQKIMFNDKYGLTKAVLERRKTQTRRLINFSPADKVYVDKETFPIIGNRIEPYIIDRYSIYNLGEIVAIAQSYKDCGYSENSLDISPKDYKTARGTLGHAKGWSNKMFVRAEACIHQIRITNVRIERLQDISNEDCMKEGIERLPYGGSYKPYAFYDYSIRIKSEKEGIHYGSYRDFNTPREAYAELIDKVSGIGTFESNPYVFVYDFELVR